MIAKPNEHYQRETLHDLLCDSLPDDQADQVESHLSGCELCRRQLEQIAGEPQWWKETVDVLAESTLGPRRASTSSDSSASGADSATSLDASLDWIRPLLQESPAHDMGLIDQYPVHSVIGQGGMGVVLRGLDRELNRPIAIKVLSPHLAGVGAARQRFMREAQAVAAVVHPSIVPIYGVAIYGRLPYIVMPCITGGNLQQRIEREGSLELGEVLRIGLQISEGLSAAHRQGVIHRDIKPANILLEEGNGRVLISDFGLARALDDATLTMSGMIAGTPQYMSPEQARGEAVGAGSDLFSLGSLLYALATGRPPFRADSPLAVLRKITETRPRPIQEINEQMPAWLDRLVMRLMQIDASRRISTADEAAELIRAALAHTRDPVRSPLPRALRGGRPNHWSWGMAAIVSSLVIGGAAWWQTQPITQLPDSSRFQLTKSEPSTIIEPARLEDATDGVRQWYGHEIDSELTKLDRVIVDLAEQMTDAAMHPSPLDPNPEVAQPLLNQSNTDPAEEEYDE